MVKDTFIAGFTGILSRYKNWTFTKPNPRIVKGETYILLIDEAGLVKLLPLVMP